MKRLFASTLCVCAALACSKAPSPSPATAPRAQPESPVNGTSLTGTVAEAINAAGYSYLRLSTGQGEVWAAVPEAQLAQGQSVTIVPQMVNQNFHSKTLNRTFDRLIFGTLAGSGAAASGEPSAGSQAGSAALPPGHPGLEAWQGAGGGASEAAAMDVKVPKAEGKNAKTVSEVFANRQSLKDAQVSVRGKVVKFLPQILNKNWVHLRDGSGSAADKTNDLVVTTQDTVNVGDVVTATGVVHVDKDYGAGYAYPAILEEAKLSK